jgi:hypothetical protein
MSNDIKVQPASTGVQYLPLVHMVDPESFEVGIIIAQAIRRISGSQVQSFGEKLTLEEAERRNKLKRVPLSPGHVPNETWTELLAQHSLREDGALITNTPLVVWGRLDGKGGIAWVVPPAK